MNLRRALLTARDSIHTAPPHRPATAESGESDNAFDFFQAAAGRLVRAETIIDMVANAPKRQRSYSDAEKVEVLRANFDVFPLLQRGLNRFYAAPPYDASRSHFYFQQFRALANLLTLDADVRYAQGDAAGAIDRYLDAIQTGQKAGQGDVPVLARLVGITCQAIAQRHAWRAVNLLPAATARHAACRLQIMFEHQRSYADNLRTEKPVGRAMIEDAFQKQDPILPPLLRRYGGKPQMFAAYDAYIDTLMSRARKRYGVSEQANALPPPCNPIDEKGDLLWMMRFKVANIEQTQNALLMTALALQSYRAQLGGYPAVLAWLCPDHLHKIPDDEFAMHDSLRYRLVNSNTYVLYSVGPDGMDGGGKPIDNLGATTDLQRRLVQPDSVGDIVAGINF